MMTHAVSRTAMDVLAAVTKEVEDVLKARPVDISLCSSRIAELARHVRQLARPMNSSGGDRRPPASPTVAAPRSLSVDLANSFASARYHPEREHHGAAESADAQQSYPAMRECPACLISATPALLSFLTWSLHHTTHDLRTLENMVSNLLFQVWLWIPKFDEVLSPVVVRHLTFLAHAARLQLGPIDVGAVRIIGIPPLAYPESAPSSPISEHDDYLWLMTLALTKLSTPSLESWLRIGEAAPQYEEFARVSHCAAARTLLFASLRLYEALFGASAVQPRRLIYPVPEIDPVPRVAPGPRVFVFAKTFRDFFSRSAWVCKTIIDRGVFSDATWMVSLRLLSCGLHALLQAEMLLASDSTQENAGATIAAPSSPTQLDQRLQHIDHPLADGSAMKRSLAECLEALAVSLLSNDAPTSGEGLTCTVAAAAQLCRMAVFVAVHEGLRKAHGKPPLASLSRVARELMKLSRYLPPATLETTITGALGEVLTMRFEMEERYTTCERQLYVSFLHAAELLIDTHAPLRTSLARHLMPSNDSDVRGSRDEAWRAVLKTAVLLVEAENPQHARAIQSWWSLALMFLRCGQDFQRRQDPAQRQRGVVSSLSNDAVSLGCDAIPPAHLCVAASHSWSSPDDWLSLLGKHQALPPSKRYCTVGESVVAPLSSTSGHRSWEVAPVDKSTRYALLCFNTLLASVLRDPRKPEDAEQRAAEYCESLATIGVTVHLPPQVIAHLLRGAMIFYAHASCREDAIRVGFEAERLLRAVIVDLPFADVLRGELEALLL